MSKRPVPKKRRAKRATRMQHSHYKALEVVRLRSLQNSPYSVPAEGKRRAEKKLKSVTRIKA